MQLTRLTWLRTTSARGVQGRVCVLALTAMLGGSGCETLNPITLGVGLVSYAATGKGLADHAIGTLTHKDCNILGGILRADRKICEPLGSAAAQLGFRGLFVTPASVSQSAPVLRLSDSMVAVSAAGVTVAEVGVSQHPPTLRLSDTIGSNRIPTDSRVARIDAPQIVTADL